MNEFKPYSDREEHRYINKMTAIIARGRLIITAATQIIDDLQAETEHHINCSLKRNRSEDK